MNSIIKNNSLLKGSNTSFSTQPTTSLQNSYTSLIGKNPINNSDNTRFSPFGGLDVMSIQKMLRDNKAKEAGYSGSEEMYQDLRSKRLESDMESQKQKAMQKAISEGRKGTFSGPWGTFTI